MDPKVAILGLACLGALLAIRRSGVLLLALGMAALWCEANLLYAVDALAWLPVVELPVAMAGYAAWQLRMVTAVFPALMTTRLVLHVVAASLPFVLYANALNALYLLALLVLTWEGGAGDVVMDAVRRGIVRLRRLGAMGLAQGAVQVLAEDQRR